MKIDSKFSPKQYKTMVEIRYATVIHCKYCLSFIVVVWFKTIQLSDKTS